MLTDKRYKRFLLLAVSAVLTGLTLVFTEIGLAQWLTLIPAAIFLLTVGSGRQIKLRALYGYGLFFFMCYYLTVFHWFVNLYPLDFIDGMTKGAALAVVLVAWLGLSLIQALAGGTVFVVIGMLFRTRIATKHSLLKPVLAGCVWSVYEWTQTIGWWGVPWGRLPIGQSKFVIGLQTASLFGSYFITFLLVAVNFFISLALCAYLDSDRDIKNKTLRICGAAVLSVLLFQYGAGVLLYFANDASSGGDRTVRVAAVQGNISSNEKWSTDSARNTREVYRKYTLEAAENGADVVVWPETALPYHIYEGNSAYKYVSELAAEAGVTILVGAFTSEGDDEYNSIVCFTSDGQMSETVYNKRRLVPFGEFVPLRPLIELLIPPLADLIMSGGDLAQGDSTAIFEMNECKIGSLICFDSIYEELTLRSVRDGAQIICLSTNDSWFTDSAALYMHNAQAQLRAIESGRFVARAANTGISTVITNRGEVVSSLEPLVEGAVCEDLYVRDGKTLYTYIGNLFVYLCIAAVIFIMAADIYLQRKVRKNI